MPGLMESHSGKTRSFVSGTRMNSLSNVHYQTRTKSKPPSNGAKVLGRAGLVCLPPHAEKLLTAPA